MFYTKQQCLGLMLEFLEIGRTLAIVPVTDILLDINKCVCGNAWLVYIAYYDFFLQLHNTLSIHPWQINVFRMLVL